MGGQSGQALAAHQVEVLIGQPAVLVGGLAVMCRLSNAYRATGDLDVVDRRHAGTAPNLEVLRAALGSEAVEPAAVLLKTPFGQFGLMFLRCDRSSSTGRATTPVIDSTPRHLIGPDREDRFLEYKSTTAQVRARPVIVTNGWKVVVSEA